MWKLILLLLINLVHKSTSKEDQEDSNEDPLHNHCGDCSDMKFVPTFFNTGHYCHPEDKNALVKNYTQGKSLYPNCVPDIYHVAFPIRKFCCFWSPQMGCTAIMGETHYESFGIRCTPCVSFCREAKNDAHRTNYGNLATIPLALPFLALLKILIPLNQLGYHDEWGLHAEA